MRFKNPIPYPLRAMRISISIKPFGFWFIPRFVHRNKMSEFHRQQGETIWWARWAWFQISYSRWL
jgi:hypothetical protein